MSMGKHSTEPDLFSTVTNRDDAPSSLLSPPTTSRENDLPRHLLPKEPKDLANAIKNLSDRELDQLQSAVLVEQQQRGRNLSSNENAQKRRVQEASVPMSVGKINAVRAAFKVGLKPSQIARQFRISQADIRKALSDTKSGSGSRE
jgi:hypothetical protein